MSSEELSDSEKGGEPVDFDIADPALKSSGISRIRWASEQMPVLSLIRERFSRHKPLKGLRICACLHITTETANLALTLKEGGASVSLCASNPLSTQNDVASALALHYRIPVYAKRGEDKKTYYSHIHAVLRSRPHITMDDGCDLVGTLHSERKYQLEELIGGTEETTTGVIRLRSMEQKGILAYPIIAVNDADSKHLFDNRYGTGQSTIDGIIRATNTLIAGKNFVVCGYGWCSRGIAMRARGMGANVIITEVDPLRALEAVMDGYRVMTIAQASRIGDIFVTATGNINIISEKHFLNMKDGAIVCNSGHFNVELDIPALERISTKKSFPRANITQYTLRNHRKINLLAQGRLVNLACAEGHPSSVMDMSFANQALCAEFIAKNHEKLKPRVYPVPRQIDRTVARLKLKSMGISIDKLKPEQRRYLASWELGT